MTETMVSTQDVALELISRTRWAVMPLAGKGPVRNCRDCRVRRHSGVDCTCSAPWCHGFYAATKDAEFVAARWPHDADGVGIATGASELVVIDVDGAAGHEWVAGLAGRGALTPTLMMRSASGAGYHLYYSGRMRSRPLRLAPTHPRAGTADDVPVDIKAAGSYVRWTGIIATDRPIAAAPETLGDALDARQRRLDAATTTTLDQSVPPPRTNGLGRCVHAPGYLERGVQMAVERINQVDPSAGGVHAQVYGAIRGIVRRHAETCGRDCVTAAQVNDLFVAARTLGERDGDFRKAWDNACRESGLNQRFDTRTSR